MKDITLKAASVALTTLKGFTRQ